MQLDRNRFPSPRYASDGPFPSLLSPMSSGAASRNGPSLTASELHRRVIMSSVETQATAAWLAKSSSTSRAVAARDLMTYEVPSHELTGEEVAQMSASTDEAKRVEDAWCHAGAQEVGEQWNVKIGGLAPAIGESGMTDGKPAQDPSSESHITAAPQQKPNPKQKRQRQPRKKRLDDTASSAQVVDKGTDAAEEDDVDDLLDDMNELRLDPDRVVTLQPGHEAIAGKKPRKRRPWRGPGRTTKQTTRSDTVHGSI